jgi:cytochrome P450
MNAPIPDLFATDILIFLSNDGLESQWAYIRGAVHKYFLDMGSQVYDSRVADLPSKIAADWPNAQLSDMNDTSLVQRLVAKSIFYVMFGVWINDAEATSLSGWRTNAGFFILPRLVQRFLFNFGVRRVQKLREETIAIIQNNGLEQVFFDINDGLPKQYRRTPVVKLADEIMFVIGLAGISGTSGSVETVGQFLQVKKPSESAKDLIDFGQFKTSEQMIASYREDSDAYIRETLRLDPPVTSATHRIKEAQSVDLAGRTINFPAGTLNQYVLSMANRDEVMFPEPNVFNPEREHLYKALTWNGAFTGNLVQDEKAYPRICPGRYLSLQVTKAIVNHAISGAATNSA